jgi:RsiW-degrading membrane proteinase PrsW (M82 family)
MPLPTMTDLARLSRDRGALLKFAFALVSGSLLLALLVSFASSGPSDDPDRPIKAPTDLPGLVALARFGPGAEGRSCADLDRSIPRELFAEPVEALLARLEGPEGDPEAEPVRLWWRALASDDGTGTASLAALRALPEGTRRRDELLGDLLYLEGEASAALPLYLAEARRFPEAAYAKRSAFVLARFEEDHALLRSLLGDPGFRSALSNEERFDYAVALPAYGALAMAVVRAELELLGSAYLIPALFTAAIWFLILLSFREKGSAYLPLAFAAFALGIVSGPLVSYAAAVQDDIRGFRAEAGDPDFKQFLHLLAGVSLREETAKLLCFLPLGLAARRRGSPLEALLLAGLVGLGFAFQENLSYFRRYDSTYTAWVRLLTANALHFSLTGVAGLALWQVLSQRGRGWENFLLAFLGVVLAHTLYNAVLSIPSLEEYAPLHVILVAVIAYRYFDPLRQHMEVAGLHRRLSPLGIFVAGSVLLTCAVLVAAAFGEPFRFAVGAFANAVGAMIPLAFAFISRFRDL